MVGTPRVQRLSFTATGTPASGPGSSPGGDPVVDRRRLPARVVVEHGEKGVDGTVGFVDGGQVTLDHRGGRNRAAAHLLGQGQGRGHWASPRIRGTRKRRSSTAGAWASTSSRSSDGRRIVGPEDVLQGQRMGGGLDTGGVEGGHLGGVVEDHGQLAGIEIELLVGQFDPGQAGHVGGVVAGELVRAHGRTPATKARTRRVTSSASLSRVAT